MTFVALGRYAFDLKLQCSIKLWILMIAVGPTERDCTTYAPEVVCVYARVFSTCMCARVHQDLCYLSVFRVEAQNRGRASLTVDCPAPIPPPLPFPPSFGPREHWAKNHLGPTRDTYASRDPRSGHPLVTGGSWVMTGGPPSVCHHQ